MLYVYIAKDNDDFKSITSHRNDTDTFGSIDDGEGRSVYALPSFESCKDVADAIAKERLDTELLANLLYNTRDTIEIEAEKGSIKGSINDSMTLLIHFGNQGRAECKFYTKAMYRCASLDKDDLFSRCSFIAVSRGNRYPNNFFRDDKKLSLPPDDDVKKLLEEWEKSADEIPAYDHLRGISILCQALLQLNDAERKEKLNCASGAAKWWYDCLWNGKSPDTLKAPFSGSEQRILESDQLLLDFREALVRSPEKLIDYKDKDKLSGIVETITNALKTKGGEK